MPIDAKTALDATADAISILGTVGPLLRDFVNNYRDTEPISLDISHIPRSPSGAIRLVRPDGHYNEISLADMGKLDENSRVLIVALARSSNRNYKLWAAVYPQRNASPDPVVNAKTDAQLDELKALFCSDFKTLKAFLEKLKIRLSDFDGIQHICGD